MDESLRLIEYLYDELSPEEARDVERRMEEDVSLRREYEELRATKGDLDRRSAQQSPDGPDSLVVDQIVAAAGEAARARGDGQAASPEHARVPSREDVRPQRPSRSTPRPERSTDQSAGRSSDREARSGERSLAHRLQMAGAALALLLVAGSAGIVWWQSAGPSGDAVAADPAVEQRLERAMNGSAPARRLDGTTMQASDVPEWDEGDEVVRLHRRIELLQARSAPTEWNGGLQPTRQTLRP